MGNQIGLIKSGKEVQTLALSNQQTDALLMPLVLAGTAIAANDWQKALITYLAWKDQSVFGIGTVGFAINDMPWTVENLEEEKRFMLEVAGAVKMKSGWKRLGFEFSQGNLQQLFSNVDKFASMVEALEAKDISQGQEVQERRQSSSINHGLCDQHGTFKHEYGCLICHHIDGYKAGDRA